MNERLIGRVILTISALFVIAGVVVMLGGCGSVIPDQAKNIKAEIEKRQDAEVARDAAIHTSHEARDASDNSRKEALSLRALADEKDSEAKRLDAEAKRLRTQEIADRISMVSWWLIGAGVITTGVALFLALRFGGRTAWTGVFAGGGTMALGFLGLAVAPWWLPMSWIIGVLVIVVALLALVRTLLQHRNAAESMAQQWKTYADALGQHVPDVRASLDALSRVEQAPSVRGLITHLLDRSTSDVTPRPAGV